MEIQHTELQNLVTFCDSKLCSKNVCSFLLNIDDNANNF